MKKTDIPKNCAECPCINTCPAPHYGGSRCKYEEMINILRIGNIGEQAKE